MSKLNYRKCNRFSKKISEIGFGAWQLGGTGTWGIMTKEEGINLVKEAVNLGVTLFDTAPGYGSGNSESILGEALFESRDNVFINTKIGHGPNGEYEFTKEGLMTSIDRSMGKLKTTYLDSVILHNPERYILEGNTDLFVELEKYKKKGIIGGYGVSIDTIEELRIALDNLDVDVIEIMFNIMHQEVKTLFDEISKRNILLIIKVPLDSGWLTGKYNEHSTFDGIRSRWSEYDIKTRANIIGKIKRIVNSETLVLAALRFILSFDAISSVIPGTKSVEQLTMNISSSDDELSPQIKKELELLYEEHIKNVSTPW